MSGGGPLEPELPGPLLPRRDASTPAREGKDAADGSMEAELGELTHELGSDRSWLTEVGAGGELRRASTTTTR